MENVVDLIGKNFNRLKVLEVDNTRKSISFKCVCDCGNFKTYARYEIVNGRVKSCGCLGKEHLALRTKHGFTTHSEKSPTYLSWQNMKARCYQETNPGYERYGGRGIEVCEEWIENFENFLRDMGERPLETSLDRIDNNGNYSKSNCRWASRNTQMNNTSRNEYLTFKGITKSLSQWSRDLGFSRKLVRSRIKEKGWSVDKALTTPLDTKKSHKKIKQ